MFKSLCFAFCTLYAVASVCDSPRQHRKEVRAYARGKGKVLGSGSFGSVSKLRLGSKAYAVKAIDLKDSLGRFLQYRAVPAKAVRALEAFQKIVEKGKGFENELSQEKIAQLVRAKWPREPETQGVLLAYFNHLTYEISNVAKEMKIIQMLATASQIDEAPGGVRRVPQFCVRMSNLKYLLLMRRYYKNLNDPESWEYTLKLPIGRRFELYLALLRRFKSLHSLGIVHCDVKPGNILWVDKIRKDVALIDFGLSQFSAECRGGSDGLMAPEILDLSIRVTSPADYFKADVYSLGSMIATNELLAAGSAFNFTAVQKRYQDSNTLSLSHSALIKELKAELWKASKAAVGSHPEASTNYQSYYKLFAAAIIEMLQRPPSRRADLDTAYKRIWRLYQTVRILDAPPSEFEKKSALLEGYLSQWPASGANAFELPAEFAAAGRPQSLEPAAGKQPGRENSRTLI